MSYFVFGLLNDRKLEDYQREHADAAAEVTEYLSNPINAFLLTKRLTSDWKSVESVMSFDAGKGITANSYSRLHTVI